MAAATSAIRILILNPNSSTEMTHGVEEAIKTLHLPRSVEITASTAPKDSPASINDGDDLAKSTAAVLAVFDADYAVRHYDAILVACFSVHPLVARLGELLYGRVVVTGIFEASILTALSLLPPYPLRGKPQKTWGIVTTGKFWEQHLADGEAAFAGRSAKFAGVYSTGLDAGDFHGGVSPEVIREKLKTATKQLLASSDVACVVMGCAGMAGLEAIIRDAAVEQYGAEVGRRVWIVDGVKAGVGLLEQTVKNARLFQ